jgi:hypothetical protein
MNAKERKDFKSFGEGLLKIMWVFPLAISHLLFMINPKARKE